MACPRAAGSGPPAWRGLIVPSCGVKHLNTRPPPQTGCSRSQAKVSKAETAGRVPFCFVTPEQAGGSEFPPGCSGVTVCGTGGRKVGSEPSPWFYGLFMDLGLRWGRKALSGLEGEEEEDGSWPPKAVWGRLQDPGSPGGDTPLVSAPGT